jgi:hypothetical protein
VGPIDIVSGGAVKAGFKSIQLIQTDSNEIQTVLNKFKSIQTLFDPNRTFSSSKNLK